MKKKNLLIALIFIISITLLGCTSQTNKEETSAPLQPLTIGVMPDLDSIPFIIAEHNGYFKEEGIDVTIEHFKSAMDRDTALQTKKLDGAISDMLAVVFFNDNDFDVKITSKTDGSFKLIAGKASGISSIDQVEGKSIGISKNTIIEYLTDRIMEISNIDVNAPEKVAIPKIPTRLEMLNNGKLDMATLPEPLASLAVTAGGAIINSSDELGVNPGIMLFTSDAIDSKTKEIQALYRAYNKAVNFLKEEKMENYIDFVIEEAGFPENIKDTLTLPNYTKASMPSEKELEEVLTWLKSKDLTSNDYTLKELSTDDFVK